MYIRSTSCELLQTVVQSAVSDSFVYFMLEQYFESAFSLSPGDSSLFINGVQVDLDISDAFTLVELLRSESNMMEGLHSLAEQYHLNSDVTQQLLKLDLRDSETMYAVDVRDPSVIVCHCFLLTVIIVISDLLRGTADVCSIFD